MATARERLLSGNPSQIHVLDPAKAARFKAATMLIPSPTAVRDAIALIPLGETRTLKQIRQDLASDAGADVTCPFAAGVGWVITAEAAEEDRAEGAQAITPWWRVTRDGKPNPKLPGGAERHLALLEGERS